MDKKYRGYAAKNFSHFNDFPDIIEVWTVSEIGHGKDFFSGYKMFAATENEKVAEYHSVHNEPIEISIEKIKNILTEKGFKNDNRSKQ